MLDKDLYDSWKSKMKLYMQNKEHGRMILESVKHGLLIWPTIEKNGVTRTKKYAELSAAEKIQANCDMKATNIILRGDDPISCLNETMAFLTVVASSRQKQFSWPIFLTMVLTLSQRLSENLGKRFVPQQKLMAEQAFWFQMSNPTCKSFVASPIKIEAPKELLVYVRDTCPNEIKLSAKKVAATPKHNVKKVRFKMDKRKILKLTLEIFRDIMKIYPREINSLNDFVVDHMHQPWSTFVALINKSLSEKQLVLTSFVSLEPSPLSHEMKETKACKTYFGFATGATPPKIARKFKKASPSKKELMLNQGLLISEGSDQDKDSGDDNNQSDSEKGLDSEHETNENESGYVKPLFLHIAAEANLGY
nr:hypothetical protein [Tanacetum cinerariifolium]